MAIAPITTARRTAISYLLSVSSLLLPCVVAAAPEPSISYYETARNVLVGSKPGSFASSHTSAGRVVTVAFEALGRRIDLELVPNDRLVSLLRERIGLPDEAMTIYRGNIPSVAGSWARLTVQEGRFAGVVWDGRELLVIDEAGNLRDMVQPGHAIEELLVIRAADIHFTVDESPGIVTGAANPSGPALSSVLEEIGAFEAPTRAVSLGVVLDTALMQGFIDPIPMAPRSCRNAALRRWNPF